MLGNSRFEVNEGKLDAKCSLLVVLRPVVGGQHEALELLVGDPHANVPADEPRERRHEPVDKRT